MIRVYYRHPDALPSFTDCLQDDLSVLSCSYSNCPTFIFGDFNFPSINWSGTAPSAVGEARARAFLDVCSTFNLPQLVHFATRVVGKCSSTLDLTISDNLALIHSITCLEGLSDHKAIHCFLDVLTSKCASVVNKK